MNAFSSGGENGTGVSGAAIRLTGASRSSNASPGILDRADQEALRVFGRRRADALQAWDVRERRLRVLRVERAAGEPAARRQPHDDRNRGARAPALLRGDRDEVIPRAGDEVCELHL